jgi:hypothetical protein
MSTPYNLAIDDVINWAAGDRAQDTKLLKLGVIQCLVRRELAKETGVPSKIFTNVDVFFKI